MTLAGPRGQGREPALRLAAAGRRYDGGFALSPVSLTLHRGTVTVVTGPNGSGKSTLLRLAAGLSRPSTGSREAAGRALYLLSGQGARAVETPVAAAATAARLSGLAPGDADEAARGALDEVGLGLVVRQQAGTLSSGQRARLTLAVALACPMALVCLDEPSAHLDSAGSQLVGRVVRRLRDRGAAVLVATHDPAADTWPADARLRLDGGAVRALVGSVGARQEVPV